MKPRFVSFIGLLLMLGAALWSNQALPVSDVTNTKHNLSVTGPGTVKAASETEVCIFCHVPHNALNAAPLWNRANPTGTYIPYASTTMKGTMGQPNGTSLLCLSCHDGTIAPGKVASRSAAIGMLGVKADGTLLDTSSGNLGLDLSNDHPISFSYSASSVLPEAELFSVPQNSKVKLDKSGQMQCSSCHDAHDNTIPKFLVMSNTASALCTTCHNKVGWSGSSHATSTKPISPAWPRTAATSVKDNACESCHRPHSAGGNQRLLNGATDDGTCFVCHGPSSVASTDIKTVNTKNVGIATAHNVTTSTYLGSHDPKEASVVPGNTPTRHVACSDCHNPHLSTNLPVGTTIAKTGIPILPGTLTGVRGINKSGGEVTAATGVTYEYEVCFRCHATTGSAPAITRAVKENNISTKFQPGIGGSYHPVVQANSAAKATSLITTVVDVNSTITCSACHNNSAGANNGGTGPKGPHGSANPYLLELPVTSSTATITSMCTKCHTYNTVNRDNAATFLYHNKHIGKGYPCSDCHDPHGVSNNLHLINFNTAVALPNGSNTVPIYTSTGTNTGSCNLTCHGTNHNPKTY